MKSINLALAFVAVALCLVVGAFIHSWLLVALSLVIAVGVFILNKKLEQRFISQLYQDTLKPPHQEDTRSPDFFN
jgi:nicotinamide riboside transporter PnuC